MPNITGSLSFAIFTIKQDCSKGFIDPTNISAQSRSSSMEAKAELVEAFNTLKGWLLIAMGGYTEDIGEIIIKTQNLSSILYDYLMEENIKDIWDPIRESSPTEIHFQKQFHRWFDALKTHRLLNRYLTISSML